MSCLNNIKVEFEGPRGKNYLSLHVQWKTTLLLFCGFMHVKFVLSTVPLKCTHIKYKNYGWVKATSPENPCKFNDMVGSPFLTLDNLIENISTVKTQNPNKLCIKCVEVVEDSVLTKSPNYNMYSLLQHLS